MKVSEIFNDFYSLLTGKKFSGLGGMMEKYRKEPLFFVMLSNLSATVDISLFDAMQEAYRLYKNFEGKDLQTGAEVEQLYEQAREYGKKWNNLWCWQLAGALVAVLDPNAGKTEEASEEKAGETEKAREPKVEQEAEQRKAA